jgi:hypothetical protein
VSFFDEGDEPTRVTRQPRSSRAGGGGGAGSRPPREPVRRPDRQTARVRQGVLLGALVLFAIVLVLGVKGCVSSRNENALKDYNRDVTSVITSSDRDVGAALFRLLGSGSSQGQDLQVQVNQLRQAAADNARRARGFDVPGDMKAAQDKLLLTLDLRADGLRKIAADLPVALGRGVVARNAVARIAGNMQYFLASDAVYRARVAPLIKDALDDNGVTGQRISDSEFMGDVRWLAPTYVATQIGASAGAPNTPPAPGLHGHGLTSVAIGDNTLQPSPVVNRAPATARVSFHVTFQNQGDNDENDVRVTVTVTGSGKTINARRTVAQTKAGQPAEVDIPLGQTPPIGTATVRVVVGAVRGEQKTDNNRQQYTVIFTR